MRKTLIRRTSVGTLVALGLFPAGCGSSSSSTASTASTTSTTSTAAGLTKADYLAQGNAICKKGNAANRAALIAYFKSLGVNPNRATQPQLVKAINTVSIPGTQAQINAIKALTAPSGDQQTVTAMLAAAQHDLDRVKANPTLLFSGKPFADSAKLLHPYGLTACAANS